MADFNTIKAQVVNKIKTFTTYFGAAGINVFNYDPNIDEITADPFCTVITSGNENDFATNFENKRMYSFTVRIFVDRARGNDAAETLMTTIVDALVDAFDQDYTLGGVVLISKAMPSAWGYVQGTKEYRVAELKVTASTWFDVT